MIEHCIAKAQRYGYNNHMADVYAENRKARFNYELLQTFEAVTELKGFEEKAVKAGKISLASSFAVSKGPELWLINADIAPYQVGNTPPEYDSKRSRRLLLTHEEIKEILTKMESDRLTIVPMKVYNKRGLVKVELALARSKKQYDKRDVIKKRETDREIRRTLKKTND